MKKFLSVVIFLVFVFSTANFTQHIKLHKFDEGLALAQKQKKYLLVDFYTDWCKWCKVMDEKTYSDANVQKTLKKYFITARINPEKDGTVHFQGKQFTNREFAQAARVTGYPSTGLFNSKGEFITLITGYLDINKFNDMVEYLNKKLYTKLRFEDYNLYKTLNNSLNKKPKDAGLNFAVGFFEKEVFKNNTKAKSYFKKAIKLNPKFAEAYAELAAVYENEGNVTKAKQYKQKAVKNGYKDKDQTIQKLKEIIQKALS